MDGLYVSSDVNVVKRLWLNIAWLLTMTIILKGKSTEGVSNTVWDTFMLHRQKRCGCLFESIFPDFHRMMEFSDGRVA